MKHPRLSHFVTGAITLALFVAVLATLHHILREVELADITAALAATPVSALMLAMLFSAASYLFLTAYDAIALHQLDRRVPYSLIAFASFASYSIAHNVGLSVLASGSVRYRLYSPLGLSAGEVVRVTLICSFTFALAVSMIVGAALTFEPDKIARIDQLPEGINRAAGIAVLVALVGYVLWIAVSSRRFDVAGWHLELPNLKLTMLQFVAGGLDLTAAAVAMYCLLPGDPPMGLPAFVGIYVTASAISFVSHIPGGLGILEAGIMLAVPEIRPDQLFASLLLFRLIYYVLPFLLSTTMLIGVEATKRSRLVSRYAARLQPLIKVFAPMVVSLVLLLTGTVLLLTEAAQPFVDRVRLLAEYLPLWSIEAAHVLVGGIGVLLLVLARGLFQRLAGSWQAALALVIAGIPLVLVKGLVYHEAMLLAAVAVLLLLTRKAFYRKASLLDASFPEVWMVAIFGILSLSVALGLFAYKKVPYSHELWWRYGVDAMESRFLRASAVALCILAIFFAVRLLRGMVGRQIETAGPEAAVRSIVAGSPRAEARLAFAGRKRFLVAEDGRAFLMYAVSGSSWVVLGDPLGQPAAIRTLIWQFRELVERRGGAPAFFDVGAEHLPLYFDIGLTPVAIGERARLDLAGFSLADAGHAALRETLRQAERDGYALEVVSAARLPALWSELQAVDHAWQRSRPEGVKQFAQGNLADARAAGSDCALLRRSGKVVGFATLLSGAARAELAIDLLRYTDAVGAAGLDLLVARLLQWGRDQGFATFDLGLTPFADMAHHALAPTLTRFAVALFRQAEHFDSLAALRADRERYAPHWSPRYLVCRSDLLLPHILRDTAALIVPHRAPPAIEGAAHSPVPAGSPG